MKIPMKAGPWMFALVLVAVGSTAAHGQAGGSGRIVGRIVDAGTGAGLSNVTIQVEGTGHGALSRVDGRYVLSGVPAGSVRLHVQSIGYGTKIVAAVVVPEEGVVEQNVALEQAALSLDAIEVSAGAERGSVGRALDQQRTSTGIVNAITAEQISRSADSDAAAAMQRVSGVTVQDGKYVFVRGLGERYTTTSLNGARIPSPEPERKVVPLDLFPSGLLQTITTSKTFTPDQSGDFSGASIDIRTREFPAERQLTVSTGLGFNDRVTGSTLFAAPTTGTEWLGRAGAARALPSSVAAAGNFTGNVTQSEFNTMIGDFRNAWTPARQTGRGSSSHGASIGGTDAVFGQAVSYLLSGTYAYGEETRAGEVRARAIAGEGGAAVEVDRFTGTTGKTSVLAGGLASLTTLLGNDTRLFFNGTWNRTADNEARFENGTSENHGGIPMQIQRLRFVERSIHSAQLGAEHSLGRHQLDWSATVAGVRRYEPDRSEFVRAQTVEGQPYVWFAASNEGAVRTFGDLDEATREVELNWRVDLGGQADHALKVGAAYRDAQREAVSRSYSISALQMPMDALRLDPETIFDGRFNGAGDSYMRVTPLSQGGSYTAEDRVIGGYAMIDAGLTSWLRLVGGARVERSETEVLAQATIGTETYVARPSYTDVLPSLALNASLSENQNLRFSASQTLARPEYRELANVMYRDVIGGDNLIGNPDLLRTRIRNYDARWEWYPGPGEVMSIGVFAKQFTDPIERVYRATSGTSVITFVNAESARNLGVELELRKRLGFLADPLETVTAFSNLTVMESEITIPASASSQTNAQRAMVGQAPWVLNGGVTWEPGRLRSNATLLYNIVGERILNAGEIPLPDVVEQPRHVLDASLRTMLNDNVSVKLDAKNLLDAAYEFRQGDVVRDSYRSGRSFSLGVTWRR
ncbi:MAG: TonB-dependent receptor [Gemmatimonadota bacterium]